MTALAPLLGLIVLCPLTAAAQNFDPQAPPPVAQAQPVADSRFQEYLSASVLSPLFYIKASSSGVLDQINKMPVEWTGIGGFSRRTTSRVGQAFAGETIRHSAAAVASSR